MLFVVFFVGVAAAGISRSTQYITQTIDTGDGTSLKIESHGIPFHVETPEARRINVKFGDAEKVGQKSISFRHGLAYIWVLNEGGAIMKQRFDGNQVILQINQCDHCEAIQPHNMALPSITREYATQDNVPQATPSVIRQNVQLDGDHAFEIESSVNFEVYRRSYGADMIIGNPNSADGRHTNKIFHYGNYKLNVINYLPNAVRFTVDDLNARFRIGVPNSRMPLGNVMQSTTTAPVTTPKITGTTEKGASEVESKKTPSYMYEGMLHLNSDRFVKMQSSVDYSIQRPNRLNIRIVIGNIDEAVRSQNALRVGEFTVEVINHSNEQVRIFRDGDGIVCQVGRPLPLSTDSTPLAREVSTTPAGIRSRSIQLEGDRTFEVIGNSNWDVSRSGREITVTIGNAVVNRNSIPERTRFPFGGHTIVIINYTGEKVILDHEQNILRCFIATEPRWR